MLSKTTNAQKALKVAKDIKGMGTAGKKGKPTLRRSSATSKKMSLPRLIKSLKGPLVKVNGHELTFERPSFSKEKNEAARLEAELATGDTTLADANLTTRDLAAPHRAPYSKLRDLVFKGSQKEVNTLCLKLTWASYHYEQAFRKISKSSSKEKFIRLADLYESTRGDLDKALENYNKPTISSNNKAIAKLELTKALNNLASNAPGLGPHSTTNAIVSDRLHVHPTDRIAEPLTPRSEAASLSLKSVPVATSSTPSLSNQVVSVTGAKHTLALGSSNVEDVKVGSTVFRGALYVDGGGNVYRPKNPYAEPTHNFAQDWEHIE